MRRTIMVTGSRGFERLGLVRTHFERLEPGTLIHGNAQGVDQEAAKVCKELGWRICAFPADWSNGRAAGMMRNRVMVAQCQKDNGKVLAFWDGESKGTKHAIEHAQEMGLDVEIVLWRRAF
jgi:hypothetical protein